MTTSRRVTLCGSFGSGHARDAAIPQAFCDLAHEVGIDLEIDLLAGRDHPDSREVIGLGLRDAERRQHLHGQPVIVTGHGVIEPLSHCILGRCAPYLKKDAVARATLFGAAVEPAVAYPFLTRLILRSALKNMSGLYVSDLLSAELIRMLVGRKKSVEVIGDLSLSLKAERQAPANVANLKRYVAVALSPRWENDRRCCKWLARRLAELASELDAAIVFVPSAIGREDDRPMARDVAQLIDRVDSGIRTVCIEEMLSPGGMAALYRDACLTIGMRLHGCVLSYAQETPFVAILHHPKLYSFAKTVGCAEWVIPTIGLDLDRTHVYGYDFSELHLEEISLVQTALNVVEKPSFPRLAELREKQKAAFTEIFPSL